MNKTVKILIQRADRLGDTIFTFPMIEAIYAYYPSVEIDMIVSPIGAEIISGHPKIRQYFIINGEDASQGDVRKLAVSLRDQQYDIYISAWNHPKMAWLGKFAKIPVRIGDCTNPTLKWLYTHRVRQTWENYARHQVEFNLELLQPLGIIQPPPQISMPVNPEALEKIQKKLKSLCAPDRKIIFIFCATGGSNLPIPERSVLEFSQLAIQSGDYQIVLGGPRQPGSMFYDLESKHIINMSGQTSMEELVALIELSDFYVGPDTGPSHIAAFLQKPMVFFSPIKPNPPSRWGPLTPYFSIIRREYKCRHIGNEACTPRCLAWVTGKLLWSHFNHVVREKMLNHHMSFVEQRKWHLLNSYRVLAISHSKAQTRELQRQAKRLKSHGLHVFICEQNGLGLFNYFKFLSMVMRRNINVIHGQVPAWMMTFLTIHLRVIKPYILPVMIPIQLNSYIKVDDLLELYQEKWNSVPK